MANKSDKVLLMKLIKKGYMSDNEYDYDLDKIMKACKNVGLLE